MAVRKVNVSRKVTVSQSIITDMIRTRGSISSCTLYSEKDEEWRDLGAQGLKLRWVEPPPGVEAVAEFAVGLYTTRRGRVHEHNVLFTARRLSTKFQKTAGFVRIVPLLLYRKSRTIHLSFYHTMPK